MKQDADASTVPLQAEFQAGSLSKVPRATPSSDAAPTGANASPRHGNWIENWCHCNSFEARLDGINELSKRRLSSHLAAEVWLHLLKKTTGIATPAETESLVRQFIQLAPEHPKASAMFETLMDERQHSSPGAPEIVFMITSCERYRPQAERVLAELEARGATACIVIGDPSLTVAVDEGTRIRLPVFDTYEALTSKVLEGLTFLRRRHGPVGIVKIDDDMRFTRRFDPSQLAKSARTLQYAGCPIGHHTPDRCWHLGKTTTPQPVFSRRHHGTFAYGPMYLLGHRAVDHLVREWMFYPGEFAGQIFEDRAIGDTLRRGGFDSKPIAFADMGGIVDESERYVAPYA